MEQHAALETPSRLLLQSKHYVLLSAYKTESQVHSLEERVSELQITSMVFFSTIGSMTVVQHYDEIVRTYTPLTITAK